MHRLRWRPRWLAPPKRWQCTRSRACVPPNATSAVLALRVNAECDCSGPADVDVGPFRYSDDSSGRTAELRFGIGSALGSGAGVSHIQARSGQAIIQNTPRFSVTADRPFTVQVPMRTN